MALRKQIAESTASYTDPYLGVNLRESEEHLRDGEARLMQNCIRNGGVRIRQGSSNLNSSSYGAYRVLGGHKYYYGGTTPVAKRLIAYNNAISVISDVPAETVLTTGMTAGLRTYFTTWSITDSVYISNGTDTPRKYDGTTFSTVTKPGAKVNNPPIARGPLCPILDRMMAISPYGIERTDPRVDNVWSSNSSWATLRPQTPGLFQALAPYSIRGTDTIYPGIIALQERAHYLITGTNFGADVEAATAGTGEDASIKLLDPTVGTGSPASVCAVPGIGLFWFTADLNVFWIKEGGLTGRYVGDKLQSTGATAGLEGTNTAALAGVWMAYFDHMLMLSIPTGSAVYASTQYWMDMRELRDNPQNGPVWYGPMTGQTIGCAWVENQQGDNTIRGGEGNSATGAFVYTLRVPSVYTDAVGTADNDIAMVYQTLFKDFGVSSREKYVQAVHADCNGFSGAATVDLFDLEGTLATAVPLQAVT